MLVRSKQFIIECIRFHRHNGLTSTIAFFLKLISRSKHLTRVKVFDTSVWIRPSYSDWKTAHDSLGNEFDCIIDSFAAPEGALIVDAGGYIGTAAIKFAKAYPSCKIITIEPSSKNFDILRKNTAEFSNIIPINAALTSESEKSVQLLDRKTGAWGYTLVPDPKDQKTPNIIEKVQTIALEKIIEIAEVSEIFILKMDIEGGEAALFETRADWLNRTNILFIELHERVVPGLTQSFQKATGKRFNFIPGGEKVLSIRLPIIRQAQ